MTRREQNQYDSARILMGCIVIGIVLFGIAVLTGSPVQ